jgi:hypothetical protein
MQFALEIQPRFDYGRSGHSVEVSESGAVFRGEDGMRLTMHTAGKVDPAKGGAMAEQAGDGLRATFTLREGEFPQAFTHLSPITLNRELDRRKAHPERVTAIEQMAASM